MNKRKWMSLLLALTLAVSSVWGGAVYPSVAYAAEDDTTKNPTKEQETVLVESAKKQQQVLAENIYQQYFGEGLIPGIEDGADYLYVVFSLLRAGYDAADFYDKVYQKVEQELSALQTTGEVTASQWDNETQATIDTTTESWILSSGNGELFYAKIVLFLSAMGKDATQAGGFNLIEKMASADLYETSKNAYMCAATVLLALDSNGYTLPKGEGYITRTQLVNDIVDVYDDYYFALAEQYNSLDMAIMPLQPLAAYTQKDNLAAQEGLESYQQEKIDAVCAKGIALAESKQGENGVYGDDYYPSNAWTLAQVMTTLGQFGICVTNEEDGHDFIKNGITLYDVSAAFIQVETGEVDEELMGYDPAQLLRGLNACLRVSQGQDALYDTAGHADAQNPEPSPEQPAENSAAPVTVSPSTATSQPAVTVSASPADTATKAGVKAIRIKKITAKKGSKKVKGTVTVSKATVTVTLKRGSKKVSLPVSVKGKKFTATLKNKAVKKLITGKATKKLLRKNGTLKKGDKIILQAAKKGYKKYKKTVVVK